MNIRIAILISAAFLLLGVVSSFESGNASGFPTLQLTASDFGNPGGLDRMQEETPGEEPPEGGGDAGGTEGGGEGEQPATPPADQGMTDVITPTGGTTEVTDQNLADALAGYKDYEVSYDTSIPHRDQTPKELTDLDIYYKNADDTTSQTARETVALQKLDLLTTLADRYTPVEEQFAADPDTDFLPEDPDRTLNYYQPRDNPFAATDMIPDELKPEMEGGGLEGAVDSELLNQLLGAQFEANLRYIPIGVVGVVEIGNYRGCMYFIAGEGRTYFLEEGQSHCRGFGGSSFSVSASSVSEDYVVLTLRGYFDGGCRWAATGPVARTFQITTH